MSKNTFDISVFHLSLQLLFGIGLIFSKFIHSTNVKKLSYLIVCIRDIFSQDFILTAPIELKPLYLY